MKHQNLICALSLLLTFLCLLSSCTSVATYRYRTEDGGYANEKTGTVLYPAPSCYQARALFGKTVLAKLTQKKNDAIELFEIDGAACDKFLADADFAVYCFGETTLPALADLDLAGLYVCDNNTKISSVLASSTDEETLNALSQLLGGSSFGEKTDESNLSFLSSESYTVKLTASNLTGLYYLLSYRKCSEEVEVYQPIESATDYENLYPTVPVTVEADGEGLIAVYHFGCEVFYDRTNDRVYPAGTLVSSLLEE